MPFYAEHFGSTHGAGSSTLQTLVMVGASAAVLTTISFVPQIIKVWRKRCTEGLSSGMYILFTTGQILWIVYGAFLHSWPIILANVTTGILSASVLFLMLQNKLRRLDQRKCAPEFDSLSQKLAENAHSGLDGTKG